MKQPLVTPLSSNDDKEFQRLIDFFNETLGFCPNSVKTMQRRPRMAYAFIELNKAVMENKGRVSSSLKRLIGFISSNAAGCLYCQAHTIRAAERYGSEQEKLANIWNYKTHPSFSAPERAALDFALAASVVPNAVNDNIADQLHQYWDDGEIVEIMGVIALFGYLNRWNDSMGTPLEQKAVESGEKHLAQKGWSPGKHQHP